MLRSLLISLMIIFASYMLRAYVDSFEPTGGEEKIVNRLEGVTIRSYGKGGIEWTIKGRSLEVVGKDVLLKGAELISEEATIRAGEVYIDRNTGKGELLGGIELTSKDLVAKSQRAYMDLREGRFYGDGRIELREGDKKVEGYGFEIRLKPMRVIISKARVNIE
ncbi:MAG: hypothetical protein AB1353_07225 [Aquificota bacterium]|nr:hypothetical protein [Aquificaceae bacterium]QWK13317.1 MAG: hypothetical protein KNN14_01510 [Aquificota bacterium]HAV39790.1 hypothetical protein [Aquificaceae bacterium]HCO39418.1 hypothetical protein [Aquificaceae bacterium]